MNTLADTTIRVMKFYHRGDWNIGFLFPLSRDHYHKIKNLESARYSKTHKCLYLPYDKVSYDSFQRLGLAHTIIKPVDISSTRQSPTVSVIAAIPDAAPKNAGRNSESDIAPPGVVDKITWQANCFFIQLKFQDAEVKFIKSLTRSYWNTKQKLWVCKGTASNLKKLQERYQYLSLIHI